MMRAIMIDFEVMKDGEVVETGATTIFGGATHADLLISALENLQKKFSDCNVYARSVAELN